MMAIFSTLAIVLAAVSALHGGLVTPFNTVGGSPIGIVLPTDTVGGSPIGR